MQEIGEDFGIKVGKTQTLAYEKGRLKRDVPFQTTFFPLQAISAGRFKFLRAEGAGVRRFRPIWV